MRYFLLIFALILLFVPGSAQNSDLGTFLHCGKVFNGVSGQILTQQTIIIRGDSIQEIRAGYLPVPDGVAFFDLSDKFVMPGVIDCHVHLEWEQSPNSYSERYFLNKADVSFRSTVYAKRTLLCGVTTVRDLGGSGVNTALGKAIKEGLVLGPRIFSANKSIAITGGHADPTNGAREDLFDPPLPSDGVADGADACRKAVREQVKRGADLIKVTATGGVLSLARDGRRPQFTEDELLAVVQTANDFGIKVAAHAHGDEGVRRATLAGVSSIEHGTFMTDKTMELMKQRGTYLVPTLTAGWAVTDSAQVKGFFPEIVRVKALEIGPNLQQMTRRAYNAGVPIAFGTDAGVYPHGKNMLEFQYMANSGIPTIECLRMATSKAAELIGIPEKAGSLKPGAWADVIAIDGNPIADIKDMMRVVFVMKGGVVFREQ